MQVALKIKKKAKVESPRSVLKRKTKVEESRALGSRVKEQESTEARPQKVMWARMTPFAVGKPVKGAKSKS